MLFSLKNYLKNISETYCLNLLTIFLNGAAGTPANAKRINESLIDKELILNTPDMQGITYRVYDVFFSRWLEMEY